MFDDLRDKAVLVTGSSTGIGAAVAVAFARCGARVAVHYNSSRAEGEKVLGEVKAAGAAGVLLQADVSQSAETRHLVDEAARELGALDVLINNAGGLIRRSPLAEIDDELIDQVIDLNVRSVVVASRAALSHMKRGGAIINTGSIAGRNGGGPGSALYASAKAFVQNFTRGLARELAPSGIRVNAVAPGVIMTPFHERFSKPEMLEAFRHSIPMERLGGPEECAGAYLFLASPQLSSYVTGQVIEVNGGQLMP